ncbi:MAG: thiamine phosphate synthase [Proteobacteria bacterium]|nr:thiamine phosphate synthase [Pseudomonadota bacterium]
MRELDLRLYAIIDPEHTRGHALPELARAAAAGGATLVQLRDKVGDTRAMVAQARAVKAVLPAHVPLIVNDHVEVAIAAGADGVHLGQEDMAVAQARARLGREPLIGLSIKTPDQARQARLALIDYVGIGGVYATNSKINTAPPIGVAGLRDIVRLLRERAGMLPICAIAGIDAGNAAATIAAGADGVAVISALSGAADPRAAAVELRAIVDAARASRAARVP